MQGWIVACFRKRHGLGSRSCDEVAEKTDVSSEEAIQAAEEAVASGEVKKMDFADSEVLNDISSTVQKVTEAAALMGNIIDENAFSSVLETAIAAVENVNAQIDLVEDLSSEELWEFSQQSRIWRQRLKLLQNLKS